jgi:S1-C subfamily serine protease
MTDSNPGVSRRNLLRVGPALAAGAVAGCSSLLGEEETPAETSTSAPTATPSPTPTATSSPTPTATPDRPSIERQVVQRDQAAITHIRRDVTGTITWPELESYNRIDPRLLGVWESGEARVEFTDDGEFDESGPDFDRNGTHAAYDGTLFLRYSSGDEFTFGYDVREEDGDVVVEFRSEDDETITYTRTEAGSDDRSVVEQFEDVVIVEAENPETQREELQTGGTGSGFIVTPEGHVVTNAHVVGADEDPEDALYFTLATETRRAISQSVEEDYDLTDTEQAQVEEVFFDKLFSYFAETSTVRSVETSIGVLHGRARPDEDIEVDSWSATIETAGTVRETVGGEPTWGRDVAILKIDAGSPLPTVPLGDSTDLGTGERVFVIGYPDIGVQDLFEDRNTTLEPTLTAGVVSARRTLNSGIETIQTDAGINGGNSGGPIYNGDGEVVGIATFKPADLDVEEVAFGLPIEIARGFMGELGIESTPGELTETYRRGLNAYWRDDCEDVTRHMERVLELWSEHPYAREFIEDC